MAVIQHSRRRLAAALDATLLDGVELLALRTGVDKQHLIDTALRRLLDDPEVQATLETDPDREPLPPAAARVHRQLVDSYRGLGPVRSTALSDALGIHRGNVDRHLRVMRELGYARRQGHGHIPIVAVDIPEAAQAS